LSKQGFGITNRHFVNERRAASLLHRVALRKETKDLHHSTRSKGK